MTAMQQQSAGRNGRHRANPAMKSLPRHEQKRLIESERRRRRSGDWGAWESLANPRLGVGTGWLAEVAQVRRNKVFSVLVRDCGVTIHLAVSSLSGDRPTWHEMQRIKSELAGPDATAVEVYPPDTEVIDEADMFHIWVVSALPFSLADDRHKRAAQNSEPRP